MRLRRFQALWCACLLGGCTNSIYFYETEKLTLLTIESRPDPSQPIQLNVGFKERAVVVAPPETTTGEAITSLGRFFLDRRPADSSTNEPGGITIKTALFTGKAAQVDAAKKMNILNGLAISEYKDLAARLVKRASTPSALASLQALARKKYTDLTDAEVLVATGMDKTIYSAPLHEAVAAYLGI